ncbi:MAG: hypothetical protein JWN65_4206 [Solirubrobacterales bacterium]|nr:hypothetical protein [Solirubrobacterales bacterium]
MSRPRYDHMTEQEKREAADEVARILEEAGFVEDEYPGEPAKDGEPSEDVVTVTFVVAPLKRHRAAPNAKSHCPPTG